MLNKFTASVKLTRIVEYVFIADAPDVLLLSGASLDANDRKKFLNKTLAYTLKGEIRDAVSYTHLTLPTILLV